MKKYNVQITLSIIGLIITLLVMSVSTYAYFTMEDTKVDEKILDFNENIIVNFIDTSNISLVDYTPGESITKNFTITNNSKSTYYYDIVLKNIVNNFSNTDKLVYTIYSSNKGSYVPQTIMTRKGDSTILKNIKISSNESHPYVIKITLLNDLKDEKEHKTFSTSLKIEPSKSINKDEFLYKKDTLTEVMMTSENVLSENDIDLGAPRVTNGIYFTNNSIDGNTIYFYRGDKNINNNVVFANYCWKILRTTENYGVKLIYNGEYNNGCSNIASNVSVDKYNNNSKYNAYVGYMYGTASSLEYKEEHKNSNSSNIKNILDKWYKENLSKYSNYIDDSVFCNNRKTAKFTLNGVSYGKLGYSKNNTGYISKKNNSYNSLTPSYNCYNDNDRFTVNKNDGNGNLNYPIGLLTIDEAIYAGYNNQKTNNNFLNNNTKYWTMSPSYYNGSNAYNFIIDSGKFTEEVVTSQLGIRPVISLKNDVKYISGDGSINSPYIINN